MEQLKENIIKEVKKHFDQVLDEDDEAKCNYLHFENLDDFYVYYNDEFIYKYYNEEDFIPIDDVLFRETYGDFNWFDALKIIKDYNTDMSCDDWDDYDDEQKVWNYLCFVCAEVGNDFLENEEYKIWYNVKNQQQKFIEECEHKMKDIGPPLDKLVKFQYRMENKYFVNLRAFRIDKASELLQVINLVYQKRLKICQEKMSEGVYINRCKHFKLLYDELLDFKQRAIEIKDL